MKFLILLVACITVAQSAPAKSKRTQGDYEFKNGLSSEVAAAKDFHLSAFRAIRALFPEDAEEDEVVMVHHLRNEVPATVHRTTVPEFLHSMAVPPVKSRKAVVGQNVQSAFQEGLIDGFTSEQAGTIEAHDAYNEALEKLLPQLKEEGEFIIPVHHVHHVHQQRQMEISPKTPVHKIRVTSTPDAIEHIAPQPVPLRTVSKTREFERSPGVQRSLVPEEIVQEKIEYPWASQIQLIEGYTPEVWYARQAHLNYHAAIRASLPQLTEEEQY